MNKKTYIKNKIRFGSMLVLVMVVFLLAQLVMKQKKCEMNQWKGENIQGFSVLEQEKERNAIKKEFISQCNQLYYRELTPVESSLSLRAKSALLMDGQSGRVLFEKDGFRTLPMASTTKIMTCIYVIENGNLDDVVTVSENAVRQPKVRFGLEVGEQYQLKDLLYALMLESYNDVAVAIAEHVGGSVDAFCAGMTQKAKEINCINTSFKTPNGLDDPAHYTTAYELCKIAAYALKNDRFREIIRTPSYTVKEITKGRQKTCNNRDRFLSMYPGAIGVKTGFTGNAGYCFVGAVEQDNRQFVSAVLACGWPPDKNLKWKDTMALMDYGTKNFEQKKLLDEKSPSFCVPVNNGRKMDVTVTYEKNSTMLLKPDDVVEYQICLSNELQAPFSKGENAGKIRIYVNKQKEAEIKIYTTEGMKKRTFLWCMYKIAKLFVL